MVPVYLVGAALTTYAVNHLYWNAQIAANETATAEAMNRIAASTGEYAG